MSRVKRGVIARAAHKKVLQQAKGFRGRRKNVFRIANEAVMRADVIHRANMRVAQSGHGTRFALETPAILGLSRKFRR